MESIALLGPTVGQHITNLMVQLEANNPNGRYAVELAALRGEMRAVNARTTK